MAPDTNCTRKALTIIGLGNDLLCDDGVGIRALRELKKRLSDKDIYFEELSVGGLELLESISSCRKCIIIDAMLSGEHPPGTISRFLQRANEEPPRLTSSHQIDLGQVLSLARLMGADVPDIVMVYGVEAGDVTTFQESCTGEVSRAIPRLVEMVCRELDAGAYLNDTGGWQIHQEPLSV